MCIKDVGPGLGEGPCWWKERITDLGLEINKSKVGSSTPRLPRTASWIYLRMLVQCPTSEGDLLAHTASGFIRINPETGRVIELWTLRPVRR